MIIFPREEKEKAVSSALESEYNAEVFFSFRKTARPPSNAVLIFSKVTLESRVAFFVLSSNVNPPIKGVRSGLLARPL